MRALVNIHFTETFEAKSTESNSRAGNQNNQTLSLARHRRQERHPCLHREQRTFFMPRVVRKSSKRTRAIIMKRHPKSSSIPGTQSREKPAGQISSASSTQPNVGRDVADLGQAGNPPSANMGLSDERQPQAPSLFASYPPIKDDLETETSISQDETIKECLPFLKCEDDGITDFNAHGLPRLKRELHIEFLEEGLADYPGAYLAYDASRPWLVYWALLGLSLLGEDVTPYRDRSLISSPLRGPG